MKVYKVRSQIKKVIVKIYERNPQSRLFSFVVKVMPAYFKQRVKRFTDLCNLVRHGVCDEPITKNKRTVYFDVSDYITKTTVMGIQRVVGMFIKYLPEIIQGEYVFSLIANVVGFSDEYCEIVKEDGKWKLYKINPTKEDLFLFFDMSSEQQMNNKKQIAEWKEIGCKLVACVYDLIPIKHPEFISLKSFSTIQEEWIRFICSLYDEIICISDSVRKELIEWCKNNCQICKNMKFVYFHLGSEFSGADCKTINKSNALVFIAVSTIEPRKGYIDMIDAFEEACKRGANVNLVIVGRTGWKYAPIQEKIEHSSLSGTKIFWYSDCSDQVLKNLYEQSDCYVSASFCEGFGLGIAESSSYGIPSLLRDIPVYKEIAGDNAFYFSDKEELTNMIIMLDNNRELLSSKSKINFLSWKESVEMAWSVINEI